MNNIPTAKDFVSDFPTGNGVETPEEYITDMLIEFTKLHAQKILEEVSKKIKLDLVRDECPLTGQVFYTRQVNKESILNAYPLDLIK